MKKWLAIFGLVTSLILVWIPIGCQPEHQTPEMDLALNLRWSKNYPGESWAEVKTGLIWAFSYLGAKLPKGSFDASVHPIDSNRFAINFNTLGFEYYALTTIEMLIGEVKKSEEYRKMGGIDIGRFLFYLAHSSWHYYQITFAPTSIDYWFEATGSDSIFTFKLSNSIVAKEERKIVFKRMNFFFDVGFIGMEGSGSLADTSFNPQSYEVVGVMPNGQLKFAIYGPDRRLEASVDTSLSLGGKPGKCQWCHEKELLPFYAPSTDYPNSMGREEFLTYLAKAQKILREYRESLQTDITYDNPQDHELAELLALGYEEPSLLHLSQEWKMAPSEVANLLKGIPTHLNNEHPFLGPVYFRKEIEGYYPYQGIKVPESSRERSNYEPDLLGYKLK